MSLIGERDLSARARYLVRHHDPYLIGETIQDRRGDAIDHNGCSTQRRAEDSSARLILR